MNSSLSGVSEFPYIRQNFLLFRYVQLIVHGSYINLMTEDGSGEDIAELSSGTKEDWKRPFPEPREFFSKFYCKLGDYHSLESKISHRRTERHRRYPI